MTKSMKLTTLTAKESSTFGKKIGWRWRQYLAAVLVNIISVAMGIGYGWVAPMLPLLKSEDSPIGIPPISAVEASWISSIATLSRIASIPAYMYAHDRLGRKMTSYLTAIPCIICWTLFLCANSVPLLLTARFVFGAASAGAVLLVPSYLSDVAEDDIKGQLGILYNLSICLGLTLGYTMGYYMSYTAFSICCLLLPILFAAAMFWLPESPVFLMTKGNTEEARIALRWLRYGQETEAEMDLLRARADDTLRKRQAKLTISDITERSTIRGIMINLNITCTRYLCGVNAVMNYAVIMFQEAGSTIEPNIATIMVGVLLTIGSLLSSFVIERSGRRPLLVYTTVMLGGTLISLGTYFYLKNLGWDLEYVGWIPLVCLCLYNLLHGIALSPLPSAIVNETVTVHARGAVQSLCNIIGSVITFGVLISYSILTDVIGEHGCFWLYAGVCVIGAISMYLTVPETKNRSIEEVVEQLKSDHYIRSVLQKTEDSYKVTNRIVKPKTSVESLQEV